ncbi:solute carrier family 22 member 15 [Manduca sexta]|uniref:Major facilitator superfamily (MFS) profile domain-containing protein n=1 Tax=Manduca sexta TaxID=7130 RepID=A0A921ZVI8_MANSE|nr:solute carrier family 22 member 15 [Manduca sexta]KAG6464788.1 hypothetical protein O3G_MSEX014728 [Manduca sexta]
MEEIYEELNIYTSTEHIINEEDYIVKSIGAFGVWQTGVCLSAISARMLAMLNIFSMLFLIPSIDFKCIDPVLTENNSCHDDCELYSFDNEVFEQTVISEFGLICDDEWKGSFIQTILMFGLLCGVSLFGWISDRYGRRTALLICTYTNIALMLAAPFSPNYWSFVTLRFLIGIPSGGTLIVGIVYIMEIVGPKHREVVGTLALLPDGLTQASLSLFAYYTRNWRIYSLAYTALSVIPFVLVLFIPESPRWLISKGERDKAYAVMLEAAERNKLDTLNIRENIDKALSEMNYKNTSKKPCYLDLFGTKELAFKTFALAAIWTSAGACFLGINQYITFLGSNVFIAVALLGCIQIPICPIAIILNKMFGRRIIIVASLLTTGLTMIALLFTPQGHAACIIFSVIGFASATIIFCIIYIYTSELFPTSLRNMGYGMTSAGAKIGAMAAPFIASINPHWIPSSIFAVISFSSSFVCIFLPETKGVNLDT